MKCMDLSSTGLIWTDLWPIEIFHLIFWFTTLSEVSRFHVRLQSLAEDASFLCIVSSAKLWQ